LFKNAAQTRETECVLFMVTPRIISSEQEETRPPAERLPHPQKVAAGKPATSDSDAEESECLTAEKCSNASCSSCRSAHLRLLIGVNLTRMRIAVRPWLNVRGTRNSSSRKRRLEVWTRCCVAPSSSLGLE